MDALTPEDTRIPHTPTTQQDAAARIRRLITAIGNGPHAFGFDRAQHLRCILKTLGDDEGLEILKQERRKAA